MDYLLEQTSEAGKDRCTPTSLFDLPTLLLIQPLAPLLSVGAGLYTWVTYKNDPNYASKYRVLNWVQWGDGVTLLTFWFPWTQKWGVVIDLLAQTT